MIQTETTTACYHCGQSCDGQIISSEGKNFCCEGCKMVFEILTEKDLCEYYSYENKPGVSFQHIEEQSFGFLDDDTIKRELLSFESGTYSTIEFEIPAIHCISCIWLLENLQRLDPGIIASKVNFSSKHLTINFNPTQISLAKVAHLLASLGYAPSITLGSQKSRDRDKQSSLMTELAVAGFCFGNIMLLSFPEYLGLDGSEPFLKSLFSFLNFVLALPVIFYSGQDFFRNAFNSFSQKQINIDVPIATGLAALFGRSVYDIFTGTGAGYLDSLSGLVFFLLIGRWFQSKTYDSLAFDRDYKSYFPLAVQKWAGSDWLSVIVYNLEPGDQIKIRNMEIVPTDSILLSEEAFIDYSFVTGEAKPILAKRSDLIYAGGRLIGLPIELTVQKKISQSYLTGLWNREIFQKDNKNGYKRIIDRAAQGFTWVVLVLALATAIYWYWKDSSKMWLILTSVLMVACPCALALAAPFTYGNMMRIFGKNGFYLKNADVIERLARIDSIIFDKTGTITQGAPKVEFIGLLDDQEFGWVRVLTAASSHPLSKLISRSIQFKSHLNIKQFKEIPGKGVEGIISDHKVKVGSPLLIGFSGKYPELATRIFVSINNEIRGYFKVNTTIRSNCKPMIQSLGKKCKALLSGDHASEEKSMREIFGQNVLLKFNQSPHEKTDFIADLQYEGKQVLMLGDGLNDSGALKQSNVGIAVTDDTGIFTPACDGILQGDRLEKLNVFLELSKRATTVLKLAFIISFFYNFIVLSFAATGNLSPLVAAILMPISSASVVGFSSLGVTWVARDLNK